MRVEILSEETDSACGTARVTFPKTCSLPYLDVVYARDTIPPLHRGVTYGVQLIRPPGKYAGQMSYVLVVEALELLNEYFKEQDKCTS